MPSRSKLSLHPCSLCQSTRLTPSEWLPSTHQWDTWREAGPKTWTSPNRWTRNHHSPHTILPFVLHGNLIVCLTSQPSFGPVSAHLYPQVTHGNYACHVRHRRCWCFLSFPLRSPQSSAQKVLYIFYSIIDRPSLYFIFYHRGRCRSLPHSTNNNSWTFAMILHPWYCPSLTSTAFERRLRKTKNIKSQSRTLDRSLGGAWSKTTQSIFTRSG